MRSDITVVQETAARGARSAGADLARRRRAFKRGSKRRAAPAQSGGEIGGRRGRLSAEPGAERRQRRFGKRPGGEALRDGESRSVEPCFHEIGE